MFKPASEMKLETYTGFLGGQGETSLKRFFAPGDFKGHSRYMAWMKLAPGATIGAHQHHDEEELYVFLKGRGRVLDGDDWVEVGPGDAVMIAPEGNDAIENTGPGELEFIAIVLTY